MTHRSKTHVLSRTTTFLLAGLMVLSTGLFVAGVALERSTETTSAASIPAAQSATPAPEGSEEREAQERQEATAKQPGAEAEGSADHEAAEQNRVLGIDGESPWVIGSVVLLTLLLIAALFVFGARVMQLVVAFALIAAVFDVREVGYQLGQAHYLIAAVAIGIVISRIATAFFAWRAWRTNERHVPVAGA